MNLKENFFVSENTNKQLLISAPGGFVRTELAPEQTIIIILVQRDLMLLN